MNPAFDTVARSRPLEPSESELRDLIGITTDFVCRSIRNLEDQPVFTLEGMAELIQAPELSRPPAENGRPLEELLAVVNHAVQVGHLNTSPGHMAYIPGSGMVSAALAQLVTNILNRFAGVSQASPGLVAMEAHLLRWLTGVFGLPASSGGVLTTGGSMGALSALVAARADRLGEEFSDGVIYVSDQTHASIAKAARILGFPARAIRVVRTTPDGRLDPQAVQSAAVEDRAAGLRPAVVVATAGTTNLGLIDPLHEIADVAAAEGLWMHVDAAYGGFFQLTERGRTRFAGIERADSIVLDAHKGLFQPLGTACLLVRDVQTLRRGHAGEAACYMQDLTDTGLPDFADLSPELTREARGLRLWLPLHLHGVAAFRGCLDEKLDLAMRAWSALDADPNIDTWGRPELTVIGWRCAGLDPRAADRATEAVVRRVNAHGRIFLSSTMVGGRYFGRVAILNHRTDAARVDEAVAEIRGYAAEEIQHHQPREVALAR